jgi:hypothetical protein
MTRLQALEAVAEAARAWLNTVSGLPYQNSAEADAMGRCEQALVALHALPADPDPDPAPAEMVEVAVWEGMTGLIEYVKAGSIRDQQEAFGPLWRRVGTTRFPLVKEDKS